MKTLIIGTKNVAKIKQIAGAIKSLNFEVIGLPDSTGDVVENGLTAQENARIKATNYSRILKNVVLSMDNALYLDGLNDKEQPGIHVRRISSKNIRPTDNELLNHYTSLIRGLGNKIDGRWEFAICVANNGNIVKETTIVSPRIFTSRPSERVVSGYPLESIQIDPENGKYISEMSQEEQDSFWQKKIGSELCSFLKSIV
ncbi:MAG: non-canonical purine NTP pyrophosphatase [Candidatus Paceibacterota bacterium]